jgi:hypothetical protein
MNSEKTLLTVINFWNTEKCGQIILLVTSFLLLVFTSRLYFYKLSIELCGLKIMPVNSNPQKWIFFILHYL